MSGGSGDLPLRAGHQEHNNIITIIINQSTISSLTEFCLGVTNLGGMLTPDDQIMEEITS